MSRAPYRENPGWDWADPPQSSDPPHLEVEVSDNPVIGTLYGANGETLRQVFAREPIGFRIRS